MMNIEQIIEALDWEREPRGLYDPIAYTLRAGGKRIRPTLVVLGAEMFAGAPLEKDVILVAQAMEVFHNFTLLHDDLMDHSRTRRGRETVWVKWNEATAVLSGDQMLIEAYRLLSNVKPDYLPRVLEIFNRMATEICEGQQYDMDFEHRDDVTIEEYIEMIRLKTSVLLANALQAGAYIAGADSKQQQAVYDFGIHVGLAFQLQDDILDVYGDPATFGKPIGGDIRECKKTYMYLTAQQRASEEQLPILRSGDVAAVTALYTALGVRETAEEVMREHTEAALEILKQLPQNEATLALKALAEKLMKREK